MANYKQSTLERCFFCGQYINVARHSHAVIGMGMHTHFIHMKPCLKHAKQAGHRLIILKEVYHAEA